MLPAFQVHLQQPILARVAAIGQFDGKHPSLACGTAAGKVLLHAPHEPSGAADDAAPPVRFLKINRKVTALAAGKFRSSDAGETLVVGTPANLLAYDVEHNSDVFYKDVPDGVNALLFAPLPMHISSSAAASGMSGASSRDGGGIGAADGSARMVVSGGNCSLQGFARTGDEVFWTVTGDNVRALALSDVSASGSGRDDLVVGSDDFAIRAFQGEDMAAELAETARVVDLAPLTKQTLGYALDNGTVGVYRARHRAWRVKSKHMPVAIRAFDIDGDGEQEIVIGWNNGKVEARRLANGEVAFKDMLGAPCAAVLAADYRMDGANQLVCCSTDGELRGYAMADPADVAAQSSNDRATLEESEVAQLSKQKAALQFELKAIETMNAGGPPNTSRKTGGASTATSTSGATSSGSSNSALRIRAGTRVEIKSVATKDSTALDLEVSTDRDYVIRAVVMFDYDAGVFEGESQVVRPAQVSNTVNVPLRLTKYAPVTLDVKVLLGMRGNATTCHVVDMQHALPKFAMFLQLDTPPTPSMTPQGSVRFRTPVKTQLMWSWVAQSFAVTAPVADASEFDIWFKRLREGNSSNTGGNSSVLTISVTPTETVIRTDDMQLAAELVQDMCASLEWRDLDSTADFPRQMEEFRALLLRVDECNAIRLKLTGEMADDSNQIKNLVIRVEDARMLNDMPRMRRYYSELFTLNNQLLGEYTKRCTNHQALLDALKDVNAMIQLAAKLRFGVAKTNVIAACRKAIKQNNIHALFYIVKTGKEEHP